MTPGSREARGAANGGYRTNEAASGTNEAVSAPPTSSSVRAPGGHPLGQVIGLFADRSSAEAACRALARRGYREDAIRLMISDETCAQQFSDFVSSRAEGSDPGRGGPAYSGAVLSARATAGFSHRPHPCPATLDVAVCADPESPGMPASGSLAQALAGSGVSDDRVDEYEAALRVGAVLLLVMTRSPDDARLIEIEWRRSYRAEKVQS